MNKDLGVIKSWVDLYVLVVPGVTSSWLGRGGRTMLEPLHCHTVRYTAPALGWRQRRRSTRRRRRRRRPLFSWNGQWHLHRHRGGIKFVKSKCRQCDLWGDRGLDQLRVSRECCSAEPFSLIKQWLCQSMCYKSLAWSEKPVPSTTYLTLSWYLSILVHNCSIEVHKNCTKKCIK